MVAAETTSFWQGVAALAPLVGGGIASVFVAWLGFRKSALSGGRTSIPPEATLAIGARYADRDALEPGIAMAGRLTDAICDLGDKFEKGIDEMRDLRRAVEDLDRKRR